MGKYLEQRKSMGEDRKRGKKGGIYSSHVV
jgi:hypothetical protein